MSLYPWPTASWGAESHLILGRLCPMAERRGSLFGSFCDLGWTENTEWLELNTFCGARSPEAGLIAASLMCDCLAQRWRQGATSPSGSSGWAWLQQSIGLKMVSCAAQRPTWGLYPKGRENWQPWQRESGVSPQLARDGSGEVLLLRPMLKAANLTGQDPSTGRKLKRWIDGAFCMLRARGRNG